MPLKCSCFHKPVQHHTDTCACKWMPKAPPPSSKPRNLTSSSTESSLTGWFNDLTFPSSRRQRNPGGLERGQPGQAGQPPGWLRQAAPGSTGRPEPPAHPPATRSTTPPGAAPSPSPPRTGPAERGAPLWSRGGAGQPPPAGLTREPTPGPSPRRGHHLPPGRRAGPGPGGRCGAGRHSPWRGGGEEGGAEGGGGGARRGAQPGASCCRGGAAQRGRLCAAGPADKDAADPASWRRGRRPGRAGQGWAGAGLVLRRRRRCGGQERSRELRAPHAPQSPPRISVPRAPGGGSGAAGPPAEGRVLPPGGSVALPPSPPSRLGSALPARARPRPCQRCPRPGLLPPLPLACEARPRGSASSEPPCAARRGLPGRCRRSPGRGDTTKRGGGVTGPSPPHRGGAPAPGHAPPARAGALPAGGGGVRRCLTDPLPVCPGSGSRTASGWGRPGVMAGLSRTLGIFAGFVAVVGAAFYPIYFRPLLLPEEYSECRRRAGNGPRPGCERVCGPAGLRGAGARACPGWGCAGGCRLVSNAREARRRDP